MELNRKLCAMRRKLSQRYWLDDSLGCCLLMWYCPFNFHFNFHYNFQFYFRKFSYLYSELTISVILQKTHASPRRPMNPQILNKKTPFFFVRVRIIVSFVQNFSLNSSNTRTCATVFRTLRLSLQKNKEIWTTIEDKH